VEAVMEKVTEKVMERVIEKDTVKDTVTMVMDQIPVKRTNVHVHPICDETT
jgi:hypothetical protein